VLRHSKITNFILFAFLGTMSIIISACSPNIYNIAVTAAQGTCVQAAQYGSLESQAIAAYPIIANNPQSAPYCLNVTIQNNNDPSQGGTNIQITSPGLVLTGFPGEVESNTPFSLIDPVASGVQLDTANLSQTAGNVVLFDPNNCATTTGAKSVTLQGGQSCEFYFQILAESYSPNVYPLTLAYNYYNGNSNSAIYTTFNQRAVLFAGTESGLFTLNTSNESAPSKWSSNSFSAPEGKINSLISDAFGNVYFATANQIYLYNGLSLIQLGNSLTNPVSSLTIDLNGNLYAGTTGSGIYIYNTSVTPHEWIHFTDTSGNLNSSSIITGISSTGLIPEATSDANFYATTVDKVFKCSIAPATTINTSCAFTNISALESAPSSLNLNSIAADNLGNLYIGSESGLYSFIESQSAWLNYTFPNTTLTGNLTAIFPQNNLLSPTTYVGFINSIPTESAVFNCTPANGQCSTTYPVYGNVASITTDGNGDVFVGGSSINSPEFSDPALNVTGAYLYMTTYTTGTNTWEPITHGAMQPDNKVLSTVISSVFTLY